MSRMERYLSAKARSRLVVGLCLVWLTSSIYIGTKDISAATTSIAIPLLFGPFLGFVCWLFFAASSLRVTATYQRTVDQKTGQPLSDWKETDRRLGGEPPPDLKSFVRGGFWAMLVLQVAMLVLQVFGLFVRLIKG